MFMRKITTILFVIWGLTLLQSCRHDPEGVGLQPKVCFTTQIKPIFETNCNMSGCHGANSEKYDFRTTKGILHGISPYKPYDSEIYDAITSPWSPMPPSPNSPLSKNQRTLILLWISQGADTSSTCK